MVKKVLIPLLLLAAGFGVMRFLTSFKKDQKRMPPRAVVRTVIAGTVHYSEASPVIETMGRITPLEKVALTPEVSGIIQSKPFRLHNGSSFRKNEILCVIDSSQIFYSYQATLSDLQNAVASLIPEFSGNNTAAEKRWRNFFSHLSPTALPDPPATATNREKLLATRYSVYKLFFTAKQLQNTLEKHTLRAPFNGTVETTQVYPSSMARAGSAMASLIRTDVLEIEVSLAIAQLAHINRSTEVKVFLKDESKSTCNGRIHRISDIIDERMQTATVYIRLENPQKAIVRSGAFVRVHLTGDTLSHAFAIPRKALYNDRFVHLIESDTLARYPVSIAALSIDSAYCTAGPDEGSRIILEPIQDAVIGMAVQDETTARSQHTKAKNNKNRKNAPSNPSTFSKKADTTRSEAGQQ